MSESDEDIPDLVPLNVDEDSLNTGNCTPNVTTASAKLAEARNDERLVAAEPVPVTLVTGFLGAGKTTLVEHVLRARHGYRVAVVLNEYGAERGIEHALLQNAAGATRALNGWVELTNGCLCCSVKGDFVAALESLMQQQERFDYILVETTGLADPGPIAAALWTDEELEAGVELDSVVTVVDARNILSQLCGAPPQTPSPGPPADAAAGAGHALVPAAIEAQRQVAYADTLLLNKTDLVSAEQLEVVEATLRRHNGCVRIVRCVRCAVDLAELLGQGAYRERQRVAADAGLSGTCGGEGGDGGEHPCGHSHAEGREGAGIPAAVHSGQVGTVSLRVTDALSLEGVRAWLDGYLWAEAKVTDIYRIKGVLLIAGSPRKHILQAVHELYDIVKGPVWEAGEERMTRIVVIGRLLQHASLLASLKTSALP